MDYKNVYLFGPKNKKDLKIEYPELGKVPEFQKLTVSELLFVWWYANQTSPIVRDDKLADKLRVMAAYEIAFGVATTETNEARKKQYYSGNFPSTISMAIDVMRKFNPTVRARAKFIIDKILTNYEKMVDVNVDDFKDEKGEINWTGRNNYVTSAAKISDTLPQLINQSEQGFGIIETKDGEEGEIKAIHRFHSINKD
jgi:hypothetical protein